MNRRSSTRRCDFQEQRATFEAHDSVVDRESRGRRVEAECMDDSEDASLLVCISVVLVFEFTDLTPSAVSVINDIWSTRSPCLYTAYSNNVSEILTM